MQQETTQAARDEQTLLELGGGLRGRMAGSFCVLESSVDAMRRYLAAHTDAPTRQALEPVLQDMLKHIACLSRLSANAADMALAHTGGFCADKEPLELAALLAGLAECVNEELTARGMDAEFTLDVRDEATEWVMGDTGLIDGLLANLISNSLKACKGRGMPARLRLTFLPERCLLYTDNGPGVPLQQVNDCLKNGKLSPAEVQRGSLGLLLVHEYADALGWVLQPESGPQTGFRLRIQLPPFIPPAGLFALQSSAAAKAGRENAQRTYVRRELDGVFGME